MSLNHETINGTTVIKLHGEFDAAASDSAKADLESLLNNNSSSCIVLDLADVSFIDSTGMGLIIYAFKRLQSSGMDFRVSGAHGQPLELFKLLRVDRVIQLFPDVEQALPSA